MKCQSCKLLLLIVLNAKNGDLTWGGAPRGEGSLDVPDLEHLDKAVVTPHPQDLPKHGDGERVHQALLLGQQEADELAVLSQDVNGVTRAVRHQNVVFGVATNTVRLEILFPSLSAVREPHAPFQVQNAQSAAVGAGVIRHD